MSTPPSEHELLGLAVRAAAMGGDLLAERYHHGSERATGSKSSPTDLVSEADVEVERMIRELLEEERPEDSLLGEEGTQREGSSGLCWVLDPLDGTVNFLLGVPQWCVSVAVRDHHGPLAGAIYDSLREEMFTATRSSAAVLEEPEKPSLLYPPAPIPKRERRELTVSERAGLSEAMVATGLAYDADVRACQGEVLMRLLPRVRDIRRFGSAALDLAWTAAGRYDAYFERSIKPWDVEAGVLICMRAGLRAIELPPKDGMPAGVLVATPALADPLLELVG
ncbi:MAG: inositol monophosphatase family protein [Solirubrobacteraceae bacterium]